MDYKEALNFIHSRPRLRKKPSLDRMTTFLSRLGNPQNDVTGIHIAGTNGKGSTVAFLERLLEKHDLKVGTFTSPFIVRFNERIQINRQPISDQDLVELVERIQPIVEQMDAEAIGGPLEFEIDTAMMFLYFKEHPVDVALIEVGIGGLFDSTNVFTPILSVITNIGWDHMEILGDTIPKIAEQKAGIIKPTVPVVTGSTDPEALKVIQKVASDSGSTLKTFKADFSISKSTDQQITFKNYDVIWDGLEASLFGEYQLTNLAVALESLTMVSSILKLRLDVNRIKSAVKTTKWAGRMEMVSSHPLVYLDGAHNLPGIEALHQTIQTNWGHQKVYIITAVLDDKLYQPMLNNLVELPNVELTLTSFTGPSKRQAVTPDEINSQLLKEVEYISNWRDAIQLAGSKMQAGDVLIITGSLYFISEVRPFFVK
ncbi:folylpolyglutamate synthase/dihydrofolate synthase family protein [Pediococcus argentinicus]|uniref:bifunctional folylpolyglutamate synthase/dihydrofolate synthase n=1 Tax=Pediococcus argentinicus TaxID=480391 RepID=UPI00338D9154